MRAAWLLVPLALFSCGQLASTAGDLPFHPGLGSAGYGLTSGYSVKLVDPGHPGEEKTVTLQLSGIGDGSYAVSAGSATAGLVEKSGRSFHAVDGTISLTVETAKPSAGSYGTVKGHLDLTLVDDADGSEEVHVSADYVARVDFIG